MSHFLIYVRRSYRQGGDADVSDEAQITTALSMLPPGATHDVIADSGGHHSGRTDHRDGLQELIRRIEDGSCDGVAAYDVSRLARDARLTLNLHHAIEKAGIPLLLGNMPHSRFDTAVGRFMLGQLALAAQFQGDQDSERARDIRARLYADGRHRGHPPFGYRSAKDETNRRILVIDPDEAAVIRRIFAELARRSFAEVADDLAQEGLPSPTRNGWTRYTVRDVFLRGKVYLGMVVLKRGIDERPGRHEPIIDPETYRSAVAGTRSRAHAGRPRGASRVYLLSGVLICDCGRRMTGSLVGRGKPYYLCRYCRRPMVRAEPIEERVLNRIRGFRLSSRVIAAAREDLARREGQVDDGLARQRARLETRLVNLRKQHSWGDIDDLTYRREKAETEGMLAQLPDESKIVTMRRDVVVDMATALDRVSAEERKRTIAMFVGEVAPDGGITWTERVAPYFALVVGNMREVSPEGLEPSTR